MKVRFTVFGKPQAKARPRFTKAGYAYTPTNTRNYEERVREAYREQAGDFFDRDPIAIRMVAYFPLSENDSKPKRAKKLNGEILPTVKPDVDNIIKVIADALNNLAYFDDKQIVACYCRKAFSIQPRVDVEITNEF